MTDLCRRRDNQPPQQKQQQQHAHVQLHAFNCQNAVKKSELHMYDGDDDVDL